MESTMIAGVRLGLGCERVGGMDGKIAGPEISRRGSVGRDHSSTFTVAAPGSIISGMWTGPTPYARRQFTRASGPAGAFVPPARR